MPLMQIWVPLTALAAALSADGAVQHGPTPIGRVVSMLDGIQAKIRLQGKLEQTSYDKFSGWCKSTITETVNDITQAKQSIEDLQNSIMQLKGNMGSLGASIKQLNSDISANLEATKESEGVRQNELESYESDKTESEQCIGALDASIKVLAPNKFLQNGAVAYQEAQLMSVAADVKGVLQKQVTKQMMSEEDLKVVRAFVTNPAGGMSAMQVGQSQNPFGDFAPQSGQIQGILKGLHDSFVAGLKKANEEEATSLKTFQDLRGTKREELKTLTSSLDRDELDFAEKKKTLTESKEQLDDTKADLESNESLFEETESTCAAKSKEHSERSDLRDMELKGIQQAVKILTSPEAVKAFKGAAALVQLSQNKHRAVRLHSHAGVATTQRQRAYVKLRALAAENDSTGAARIASQVKSGSAFDKIITMIDRMIEGLRKEEQTDITHRDRCENSQNTNSNEKEDLAHAEGSMKEEIARMEDQHKNLQKALDTNKQEQTDIKKDMQERLGLRNEENTDFKIALEADTSAVKVIALAQSALAEFYKKQGKLLQTTSSSVTEGKPDGALKGKYEGQKGLNQGAMGALDMIKEDLEKEIKTGRAEDDENQQKYEKDAAAMGASLKTKKDTMVAIEKQVAELGVALEDKESGLAQNGEDASEAEEMAKALQTDCAWVKSHFEKRRSARKTEIAGLQEAKDHLAKAGQGEEDDELDLDGEI